MLILRQLQKSFHTIRHLMQDQKKISIMQPYFMPYMGYWQLIALVDEFIVYDKIQYTKKGWINRNRFLQNGKDAIFSLPLKKNSDYLNVDEREISESFDREALIRQLHGAYVKAPFFDENFQVIKIIIEFKNNNLFDFIFNSIEVMAEYLSIQTQLKKSSDYGSDYEALKGQDKVISLCLTSGADHYINPIGGVELYDKNEFERHGVSLSFMKSRPLGYDCWGDSCLPHMSIIDVLMFNSQADVIKALGAYDWVTPQ